MQSAGPNLQLRGGGQCEIGVAIGTAIRVPSRADLMSHPKSFPGFGGVKDVQSVTGLTIRNSVSRIVTSKGPLPPGSLSELVGPTEI